MCVQSILMEKKSRSNTTNKCENCEQSLYSDMHPSGKEEIM